VGHCSTLGMHERALYFLRPRALGVKHITRYVEDVLASGVSRGWVSGFINFSFMAVARKLSA